MRDQMVSNRLYQIGMTMAIAFISCYYVCDNNNLVFVQANTVVNLAAQTRRLNTSILQTSSKTTDFTLPSVAFLIPRGGATYSDDESEYDLDESEDEYDDEYDDESEEEEVVVRPAVVVGKKKPTKLSSSAVKASTKAKQMKNKTSKKVINASLQKKKKVSKTKPTSTPPVVAVVKKTNKKRTLFSIPYVLKAFLNPFTVFAMTRGYFASLVNIDYLKEDSSQTLRSELEEKAKRQAASGGKKPGRGRKMKPGQAKTLSDLPQLNT